MPFANKQTKKKNQAKGQAVQRWGTFLLLQNKKEKKKERKKIADAVTQRRRRRRRRRRKRDAVTKRKQLEGGNQQRETNSASREKEKKRSKQEQAKKRGYRGRQRWVLEHQTGRGRLLISLATSSRPSTFPFFTSTTLVGRFVWLAAPRS